MDIDGKWVGWGLGDVGATVVAIKAKLKAKFSYASALDDTDVFGADLQAVVITYQKNKNGSGYLPALRTDGIVDDATQIALGLIEAPKHVIITFNGTWGAGLVQYPSNVVDGLAEFVNPNLCVEVQCPYPASFGFLGGGATDPSYQQSVQDAITWMKAWLTANPTQTFGLGSYSQGAEAASRIYMQLIKGSKYEQNFIGAYTLGNPCRGAGFVAPGVTDPGGHGISSTLMTELPTIKGTVVWADYVHSKANGDAGDDMYAFVADPGAPIMTDFYTDATEVQLNDPVTFASNIVNGVVKTVEDVLTTPAGDLSAAGQGIAFLAAPGGPTMPHTSYLGPQENQPEYSNLVASAVGFLQMICELTPAHA